jgi:hypothetical protein
MRSRSSAFSRVAAACALLMVVALYFVSIDSPSARADASGQLAKIGQRLPAGSSEAEWLASPTNLSHPGAFGVDPATGNVFVVDNIPTAEEEEGSSEEIKARLQEFDASGNLVASAIIPRPLEGGFPLTLSGIAFDPTYPGGGRLYLVGARAGADHSAPGTVAGVKILAYSTEATPGAAGHPGTLHPVTGLENGLSLPDPSGADGIHPVSVAVEPDSHDVLVLGEDRAEATVVARFEVVGQTSAAHETGRFVESGNQLPNQPLGMVVAPNGKIYEMQGIEREPLHVYEISSDLGTATDLPDLDRSGSPGGANSGFGTSGWGAGNVLAISPDGKTLYYDENILGILPNGSEGTLGYQVRGVSVADGTTVSLFGGGETTCKITTGSPALGVAPNGNLWVENRKGGFSFEPVGGEILEFGPGGSGCPIPNPRFSINGGNPEESSFTVGVGSHLKLQADTSDLHGATPTAFEWDLDGSGTYATHEDPATGTSEEVCFESARQTTLGLRMKVSGGALEEVPPVTKSITVTPQAPTALVEGPTDATPGQALSFDGSRSFRLDCSAAGTSNVMSSYSWNFGDGSGASGENATHAFASPGTYAVTLRVEDAEGLAGEATQAVTVSSPGGGGGGGGGGTGGGGGSSSSPTPPAPTPPSTPSPITTQPAKPKQTPEQKALAKCAKKHGKAKTQCVKAAKKKFAKKSKKHGGKK